ncbi:MAG: MATE family efflux transporter [Owenweeksia sp.]|nr:MATE family efflux transporter [Owenweeksia sp.]
MGQILGAQKPGRAERSVWATARYNLYFTLSVSIIYLLFAETIISFFNQQPEVVRQGALSLRIVTAGYFVYAYWDGGGESL